MRGVAGEVAVVALGGAGERFVVGDAERTREGAPVIRAAFRIRIAKVPEAVDALVDEQVKIVIGQAPGNARKALTSRSSMPTLE